MGIEIRVDVDALGQLVSRLALIHDTLASTQGEVSGFTAATGSPRVDAALGDFADGWADDRRRIEDNLVALHDKAQGAVRTYADQEAALAASLRGQPAGAPGGPR